MPASSTDTLDDFFLSTTRSIDQRKDLRTRPEGYGAFRHPSDLESGQGVRLEAEFCFKFMLLVQQFCGDTQQKTFLALLFEHLRTTLWGDADCDRKVVPK